MKLIKAKTGAVNFAAIESEGAKKIYLTADLAEDPTRTLEQVLEYLKAEKATVVSALAFGSVDALRTFMPDESTIPAALLQGDTCHDGNVSALRLTAVAGTEIEPVLLNGVRVGSSFAFGGHRHCVLPAVHAIGKHASRGDDVAEAFDIMLNALRTVGFDFSNVIRMWNYLDDLLEWYDEFNAVRNAFFTKHAVYDSLVPAGTGIGAANQFGTAYAGELWAVKPENETNTANTPAAYAVPSPLQCPALDYKSSFSRAVELESDGFRTLTISGTASIAPNGETVFLDDASKQMDKTLEVISAILKSRGMEWTDTVRAIAYFADIADLPLLKERLEANGIPLIPVAVSHAAICRDDLLFEMELDAVTIR